MEFDFFTHPGSVHLRSGRSNEDCISVLHSGALICTAVCDGAGSFGAGQAAAELTAQVLTGFLSARFDDLFDLGGSQAQKLAAHAVEEALQAHSLRSRTPVHALACTILAAAVHEDGRCICLHLGDGLILQRNHPGEAPSVVSAPMNGLAPHSTYLTMNCDMERYLRLYRWQCPSLRQLLLLTDGASEPLTHSRTDGGLLCAGTDPWELSALRILLAEKSPPDDHSVALITRIVQP